MRVCNESFLDCKSSASDKFYNVFVALDASDTYTTYAEYGRNGGKAGSRKRILYEGESRSEARDIYVETVKSKLSGRSGSVYVPIGKGVDDYARQEIFGVSATSPAADKIQKTLERLIPAGKRTGGAEKLPVLLEGPPGTGKTYSVREFYKASKGSEAPFDAYYEVGGFAGMEAYDFMGGMAPHGAGFIWMDGPVTRAFRDASEGKKVLLGVDELLRIPARDRGVFLNALTPHNGNYFIKTGRPVGVSDGTGVSETLVVPVDNVSIVGMTNSGSDFAEVEQDDPAAIERWHIVHVVPDLKKVEEILKTKFEDRGWTVSDDLVKRIMKVRDRSLSLKRDSQLTKELTPRLAYRAVSQASDCTPQAIGESLKEIVPMMTGRTPDGMIEPTQEEAATELIEKCIGVKL